jgi:alkyl sulfatase BDS1-like metallo-beta-lactamase superfamily hydrolase
VKTPAITVTAVLICIGLLFSPGTRADSHAQAQHAVPHRISDNIAMLQSQRVGNIGLFHGDDGVILIDDQMAPMTEAIMASIKSFTDRPIRFVLNTHWNA